MDITLSKRHTSHLFEEAAEPPPSAKPSRQLEMLPLLETIVTAYNDAHPSVPLTLEDIRGRKRVESHAYCRAVAAYIKRQVVHGYAGSHIGIGRELGNHMSVPRDFDYAVMRRNYNKIQSLVKKQDPETIQILEQVCAGIHLSEIERKVILTGGEPLYNSSLRSQSTEQPRIRPPA